MMGMSEVCAAAPDRSIIRMPNGCRVKPAAYRGAGPWLVRVRGEVIVDTVGGADLRSPDRLVLGGADGAGAPTGGA